MSSRLLYSILLAGIFTLRAGAETPVATISSSAPFEVRGVRIPVVGVPSWPLVQGDVVATTTAPAVVSFPDLSQATVEKGSRIELKRSGNHTALKLLGGSLSFRAATGSTVQLQTLDRAITPVAGSQTTLTTDGVSSQTTVSQGAPVKNGSKPKPPPPPPPPSPSQ